MIRQGYSMKEKKAIVDFIVSKEAYGKVKGREVWIDFEKIGDIERTWQSAKEVFIKRILPEINNPYYKLSAEQIKFFRTGINQPVANTLDWMCKDNKNKLKPVDKAIPLTLGEISNKTSDSELVLLGSGKPDGDPKIFINSTPIANSDHIHRLIDVIGRNEPNNMEIISADSELITSKDIVNSVILSSDDDIALMSMVDSKNVHSTELPNAQFDARQNILDDILLPSTSSNNSEDEKNTQNGKNLSSKLGFSTGRTFVSKNVEKNSKKAVKAFELKNTNNLHVPNMFRPNHSSNSLKAMRMKRKMSHRTTSSTESSSSSQFSDDESSSYSSSSQSLKSHSYKPNGTVKDLVKTRKPIYAFYKGQLFPLYVAKSKVKHYRPDSTRPWHPASRRSRKSSQKRKSSNRCYPKYDNIVLSTDSDEDLTYYGKPEKRYKRHIENGNRKDLQSHRSSNEHKLITKVPSTPSPGCLPETKFNKKIQNTMQTRVDLDFPNDEIEMRYYKDLERFYDGGQVGQKPVKQWYQRVLTEDEKRKHKKYSHLYKTGPEISNVPKTPDSQAFWKIKYLMEKKNLNEVCKYMAEKTPTVTNSMDELNKINKRNSSISLNDKTPSAVQKKKTNGVSDKNEFEIIEGDNKTNTIVNPSDDCNLDKEKIIQKTSPKPKMSNCIIKYSKHGNDIINKSFPMNTQKEGLLFSVLKSLGKTETSESVTQPGASGKDNAVTDVACKMTDVKDVKVEEKLSIQEKEKKIFEEIEKEEEIVINSSGSGKRDIFTPLELSLLLNNSKSVCEKDTLEEVSEKKKSSDVIPKDDTSKEQESKTRIVKTNVNRSVEMRRSPRVKTQSIEGPSHSTPKRTSLKVEELNPDENFSHIQEAGESLPKQNNNDSDSKDSDGFFANTTFQFNPVYKDTSNQKTLKKVCSSTSSDSEAMYSFPKAPRTKWKISLKTKKSKSKKACDANLNSSKKRLSQPMKNVILKNIATSPLTIESQEVPLQNKIFDFLRCHPSKKSANSTSTAINTINFNLQDNENTLDTSTMRNESVINTSLPLLEQDIQFATRIVEKDTTKSDFPKDEVSFKALSESILNVEEIQVPSNEMHIEDLKILNSVYEKKGKLSATNEKTIHDSINKITSDTQIEENTKPMRDEVFNTTASSFNTDSILESPLNQTNTSVTSKSGYCFEETGINLSDEYDMNQKIDNSNDFKMGAIQNLMDLKNIMTEEDSS